MTSREHRRAGALAALLGLTAGCAGPQAPRPLEAEPTARPSTPADSSPIRANSSTSAAAPIAASSPPKAVAPPAPPPPPCARMGWIDACSKREASAWLGSAPLESDALAAWYSSRGAAPPPNEIEPTCREITVGPQGEAALLCGRIQHETRGRPESPLHTFRVLSLVSVRTARAKRAITLFETPISVDLLDKDELDDGPLFELDLGDIDGRAPLSEITLREPKPGACAEAEKALKSSRDKARASNDAVMTAWARIDEEIRARLCAAAGTYRWQKDRFVRARAEPESSAAAPAGRRADR